MAVPFKFKLKDRKEIYKIFCDFIASGKSARGFVYQNDGKSITGDSIRDWIEKHPKDYDLSLYEVAKAKCFSVWEDVVHDSARGTNKDAGMLSLKMIMRNKFGWEQDKPFVDATKNSAAEEMKDFFKLIRKQ